MKRLHLALLVFALLALIGLASCGGREPDFSPVLCESCAHVSLCVDNTLFDCIRGQWGSTECARCIPAGEETIIGVQNVPVCMADLPLVRHWDCVAER